MKAYVVHDSRNGKQFLAFGKGEEFIEAKRGVDIKNELQVLQELDVDFGSVYEMNQKCGFQYLEDVRLMLERE